MYHENIHKNIFGFSVVLELKVKKLGLIFVTKYVKKWKSKLSKYVSNKKLPPFLSACLASASASKDLNCPSALTEVIVDRTFIL